MQSFNIKINGKYLKEFIETEIPQKFRGNWHNHTKQSCLRFVLCEKSEAKIVEGKRNLKSYLESIIGIMSDGYFKIDRFEVQKVQGVCFND